MSTAAPTFSQIKAQVAAIRQKSPDARVIGIRAQGRWTGDRQKQDGAETYLIEQCDSPLAMRIALGEANDTWTIKVLITSLDETNLGEDVLLRLAKRKLHSLDSWQIVKSLFQAHSVDPRLTVPQHSWIAEYLMDWVPKEGYPSVSGGFLDAETVWSILLVRGIGLHDSQPDLLALLNWSINAENVARFRVAPENFREAVVDWLTVVAGPAAKTVLKCIAINERPDAVPLGLAVVVLFHTEVSGRLDKAVGKLEERYLGGMSLDASTVARWSVVAAECLQQIDQMQKQHILQRADEILHEVGAEAFAYLSNTSPLGFERRLVAFGKRLVETLKAKDSETIKQLAEAHRAVLEHDRAKATQEHRRLECVNMAIRLVRWLIKQGTGEPTQQRSLALAIADHLTEGGFVDWARLSLRSGDQVRELSEAYAELFEKVAALREKQAYQFAILLHNWTEIGSTGKAVLPVEQILECIVAPLASHAPVLAIVMDGMSMAACRELVADITAERNWICLCQEGQTTAVMAGLAAIPSVTEVSRTSLLCGQLRRGKSTHEKAGFSSHPSLLARCRTSSPPVLFHKPALREDDAMLADQVRKAISSPQNRIVGVVVNAIDDYLLKGEQIDIRWTQNKIKVLSILLHEAKVSNRLVILLSDHGHVIDHKTKGKTFEGGERWRLDNGQPEKDEMQISGLRVVMPESKSLIAPWTERLRYGTKKNGYHGGITPQEMVVPIAVLCSSNSYPTGWVEAPVDTPIWWEEPINQADNTPEFTPPLRPTNQVFGPLFNLEAVMPEQGEQTSAQQIPQWVKALLSSPIYNTRKKLAGRAVPGDDVFANVLTVLDSYGGKMTSTALARTISYPIARVRSLLTVMQRVLNIDGYAVVQLDEASDTIKLNHELLCQQFDLIKV